MANYELMVIINPSLSEEERNTSIDNLKSILEKYSAKITKEDVWAEKKLAYKINRSETGYYILFELELDWKNIKEISKETNLDRNIWRYMYTKKES